MIWNKWKCKMHDMWSEMVNEKNFHDYLKLFCCFSGCSTYDQRDNGQTLWRYLALCRWWGIWVWGFIWGKKSSLHVFCRQPCHCCVEMLLDTFVFVFVLVQVVALSGCCSIFLQSTVSFCVISSLLCELWILMRLWLFENIQRHLCVAYV